MSNRRRLDRLLVGRGFAADIDDACTLIADDRVTVAGAPADNPARLVAVDEAIAVDAPPPRFVSRAGDKLAAALEEFKLDVTGRSAIDVGASTGGFTDCLLQAGASRVVAIDVGRGQLAERIRRDERVVLRDRCNVRSLDPDVADAQQRQQMVGDPASMLVADVSFISLRLLATTLVGLVQPGGDLVVLIKPQFEATRAEADLGSGIISDPAVWERVLCEVVDAFAAASAAMMGVMPSPVTGARGNQEFLVHLQRSEQCDRTAPGAPAPRRFDSDAVAVAVERAAEHAVDRVER